MTSQGEIGTNIIDREHGRLMLIDRMTDLCDILVEYAGPFARDCIVGSAHRQVNDVDTFTKDGITIARVLSADEDPIARLTARLARFVGIAVDNRCHDGTTTSMLLLAYLTIELMKLVDNEPMTTKNYFLMHKVKTTLKTYQGIIDTLKITDKDLLERCRDHGLETTIKEVRHAISYHMAMISSKGDHDLSTKIATIVRSMPDKLLNIFSTQPMVMETDEKYLLTKQDYDISVGANFYNRGDYNHRNGTEFLAEDAAVYMTANDIVTDSMESSFLCAFISEKINYRANLHAFGVEKGWEAFHDGKRQLVICTPKFLDNALGSVILEFNRTHPNNKIVVFITQAHNQCKTSFAKAVNYMSGTFMFQDVVGTDASLSIILKSVKVHFVGHLLMLHNLYERDGEIRHPYFNNSELFPAYNKFEGELKDIILKGRENIANPSLDQEEVNYLIMIYRSLTCQEVYTIHVGGSIHDQYANRTVYEDAMGAAMSAVDDGVVLGGYGHLALWDLTKMRSGSETQNLVEKLFQKSLLEVLSNSLRCDPDLVSSMVDGLESKWHYIVASVDWGTETIYSSLKMLDKEGLRNFLTCEKLEQPILFQAYAGYEEQFGRFYDILPRLVNSANLADMRIPTNANNAS